MQVLKRHALLVPPEVNETQRRALKREFTVINPAYQAALQHSPYGHPPAFIPKFQEFFHEDDEGLWLPRGSGADVLKQVTGQPVTFRDDTVCPRVFQTRVRPVGFKFTEEQQQVLRAVMSEIKVPPEESTGCVLFLASTSVGKTILLLEAGFLTATNLLILCNTKQVMLAWQAEVENYLRIPLKEQGLIHQKKFKLAKVTIAMTKTLARREDRWPEVNAHVGCLILDEPQDVTAPTVYGYIQQSPARWRFGATATATKRDQELPRLKALFGEAVTEVRVFSDTATVMKLGSVRIVDTAFNFPIVYGGLAWDEMLEYMAADEDRLSLVCDWIQRDWEKGRVVLATARSRDYIECLYDELHTVRGIPDVNTLTGSTNTNPAFVRVLIRAINNGCARVLLATDATIKVGANIRRLDSLHICTPHASQDGLEQLVGRIRRRHPDKAPPSVTYYRDSKVLYLNALYRRCMVPVIGKHLNNSKHELEELKKERKQIKRFSDAVAGAVGSASEEV